MADFSVSVKAAVDKAMGKAEVAFRGIAAETVAAIQEKTPVRTGYLRANFSAIKQGDAIPVPGSPSLDAISSVKLGDTLMIVNPVEYARMVEFGFVGEDASGRHIHRQGRGWFNRRLKSFLISQIVLSKA